MKKKRDTQFEAGAGLPSGTNEEGKIVPRYKRRWSYGYGELAALFGMSRGAVRKAAQRGRFDPSSLRSVMLFQLDMAEKLPGLGDGG